VIKDKDTYVMRSIYLFVYLCRVCGPDVDNRCWWRATLCWCLSASDAAMLPPVTYTTAPIPATR